ncbi:hypothetical protein AAG906_037677 [Vitis piasezkii]
MEAQNNQHETQPASAAKAPVVTSCRKKKSDDATFLQDVKDHIDEFIHASMDEHKTCFTKTIKKMFGMSKVVAERNSNSEGVESSLPPDNNSQLEYLIAICSFSSLISVSATMGFSG